MSRPLLLLVDDCPEMGLIVACLGRRAGWDVTTCPDAETAWAALAARRPDLVLLDVNLTGANGLDWFRRVRLAPECRDVRVALYTSWGRPGDVAAGLEAGVDFVFDKDLAARPAEWQTRLEEIWQTGQDAKVMGAYPADDSSPILTEDHPMLPPPRAWAPALRQAFRHPSLRRVAGEVVPPLVRRALTRAFETRILPQEFDAWVGADGLDPVRFPPTFGPASFGRLAVCLADQIRCLLGDEAGRAFLDALGSALPGGEELLSRL